MRSQVRSMRAIQSLLLGVIAAIFAAGKPAQAQVEYVLTPAQSKLTVTVTADNFTFPEQFTGSRVLTFGGSIFADRTSGIEFLNTTNIDAIAQGTNIAPDVNGAAGSSAGDAGINIFLSIFDIGDAALRDITATLTSGTLGVTSGAFDADGVTLAMTGSSALDHRVLGVGGRELLAGESGLNDSGLNGTLTPGLDTETLYLPINLDLQFEFQGDIVNVNLAGSLQGTADLNAFRLVPEPGTFLMAGAGLVGFFVLGRRRIRRT